MANLDYSLLVGTRLDTSTIQSQLNTLTDKKVTVSMTGGDKYIKTVKSMKTETGDYVETTKKLNTTTGESTEHISKFSKNMDSATKSTKNAKKGLNLFGQSMSEILVKVAKFYTVTKIIQAITGAISDGINSVKELDASLIELRKVTDLSGGSLEAFTKEAFDMASQLSTTATNVVDAVTEFAKSNYTLEESQQLAEQALIFQTIADGAISASDSATTLIQVMKAYNMEIEGSIHVIDAMNSVSNNYAVSSTDLN